MFGKINTDSIYYVGLQNLFGCPRGGHGAEFTIISLLSTPRPRTPGTTPAPPPATGSTASWSMLSKVNTEHLHFFCHFIEINRIKILEDLLLLWLQYKINCEAQGKGRAKGQPRKVTKRSFMDGGWWMVDILSLMLYTKFGCHHHHHPPSRKSLNLQD